MLTCTDNPAANYQFSSWGGLASGTTNPVTFNVTSGGSLIANFNPILVPVTFNDVPASGGTITCGSQTYANGQVDHFQKNSQIICTANPAAGYQFSGLSGLASGSSSSGGFNVGTGGSLTANFTPQIVMVSVTFGATPTNGVTITCSAKTYSNGQNDQFAQSSTLTCTAHPPPGYKFSGWNGLASGTQNPVTFNVGQGGALTANFTQITTTATPLTPSTILLTTLIASASLVLVKRRQE